MSLKRAVWMLALVLVLAPMFGGTMQGQTKRHQVVFAITSGEEADWNLTLGNIRNLLTGLEKDGIDVEVVAYGPGLMMVTKTSTVEKDLEALVGRHVRFVACENSMRAHKVAKEDLLEGVGTVPSGIVEVVTKQEQGWTYIKAGR